jgi:hypothetical protein
MFRRAKLILADVEQILSAEYDARVLARVDQTDRDGGPRCARLRYPAVELTLATA